jgi:hypothetical protein
MRSPLRAAFPCEPSVSDTAVSLLVPRVHRVSSSSPSSPSWVIFGAEDPLRPVQGAIAEADPKKLVPILAQHGGGPRIFQPLPIPLRKADQHNRQNGAAGDHVEMSISGSLTVSCCLYCQRSQSVVTVQRSSLYPIPSLDGQLLAGDGTDTFHLLLFGPFSTSPSLGDTELELTSSSWRSKSLTFVT